MADTLSIDDVSIHAPLYPREQVDEKTVDAYVEALEAGAEFPPIEVQHGTHFVLDGAHRLEAHRRHGAQQIAVVVVDPADPLEYAIAANMQHGKQMSRDDKKRSAELWFSAHVKPDDDFPVAKLMGMLAVGRRTVYGWFEAEIANREAAKERARVARQVAVAVLSHAGWTQQQMADHLDVAQSTVNFVISECKDALADNDGWGEVVASVWTDVQPLIPEAEHNTLVSYFTSHVPLEPDLEKKLATGKATPEEVIAKQAERSSDLIEADRRYGRMIGEAMDRWLYVEEYLNGHRNEQIDKHLTETQKQNLERVKMRERNHA